MGSLTLKPPDDCILPDLTGMQMMLALDALIELLCCRLKQNIAHRRRFVARLTDLMLDGLEKDLPACPLGDPKGRFARIISAECLEINPFSDVRHPYYV